MLNAAIARNIGASYSNGEFLIFLDGDMELQKSFIAKVFDERYSLNYNFISGNILEYYYDDQWKYLKKAFRTPNGCASVQDKYEITVGGFFCVKHSLWDELKGMNCSLTRCEDLDFGLKLSKKKILLLRIKEIGVIHHTISPLFNIKLKNNLFSFSFKYYGLLYRKHLMNKYLFLKLARSEFTLFFLLLGTILTINTGSFLPFLIYPSAIFFRFWYHSRNKFFHILDIINIIIRDFTVFISFIFFFPSNKNNCYKHSSLENEAKKIIT